MATGVTIVILNWNGFAHLQKFLPSVLKTDYPDFKLLIMDNGSTDDSLDLLMRKFGGIQVVSLDQNYGFTIGNNMALAYITTPYYVLLNNDVEVEPDWLWGMAEVLDRDPKVAAVQPKLMAYNQKDHFEYAGAAGGYIDIYGYPFARGRIFEHTEKDEGQFEEEAEIFWATGACMMVRKSVSDKIGLFEEAFFAHMEEIDFCWRLKNYGYKVMYTPKSKVYHLGGGTLNKSNPRKTFLNAHNSLACLVKNYSPPYMLPRLFVRLCLDGVWAIRSLSKGDFGTIGAIFKAHWKFFFHLRFWFMRRKYTYLNNDGIPGFGTGFYPRSIVYQHFVKGFKRFRDLPGIK